MEENNAIDPQDAGKIREKIASLYRSEKGQKFISHLVRSFLPLERSQFLVTRPEKGHMKCCITGVELIAKDEILEYQINHGNEIFKHITSKMINELTDDPSEKKEVGPNPTTEHFKGKLLGIHCKSSDRFLCQPALQQLAGFVMDELLKNNKHMNYITGDEIGKEIIRETEKKQPSVQFEKKEVKTIKQAIITGNSLGDNDALRKLKEKFNNND